MKIDNTIKGVTSARGKEVRNDKPRTTTSPAANSVANERVVFTPTSAQLSVMEETLANIGVTDARKIDSVREAIADGSFQVNEEAVADALVETTMEQLRRQNKT